MVSERVYWRVEGSLLTLTAVRPVGFFAWNAQSFLERWARRGLMGVLAAGRPALYLTHRVFATRVLHSVLRNVSQDRLDLLGEEYFEYTLKPRLDQRAVTKLRETMAGGAEVVLVSQGLEQVMRPLAAHLGVGRIVANRLEFHDGLATGRLLEPVIRPRGPLALLMGHKEDGRVPRDRLVKDLKLGKSPKMIERAIRPAERQVPHLPFTVLEFDEKRADGPLSVRDTLKGKNILLIGGTGFIGKVWLANSLAHLPAGGKIFLLVRRNKAHTALERFRRAVEESPVFDRLAERHGEHFGDFLAKRVEVVEGDVTKPRLGVDAETQEKLQVGLDLIINSSGLTDFNPDLRDALAANVRAIAHLLDFLKGSRHATLLHLSTCYITGARDGRILETIQADYCPAGTEGFSAEEEWAALEKRIEEVKALAESNELTEELRRQAIEKRMAARDLRGAALEIQVRKNRVRWVRQKLTDMGTQRANELGWPNTYTLTKSLAESLLVTRGAGLPIAVVRPAIVESSVAEPFRGWNEGINTSASLSYLLGTYFRQLPTNERKCLDLIPVDLVARGMTMVGAALIERRHDAVYHLATSVTNPCNMRRSIELTSLGHRRYYRAQEGFRHWLRSRFDAIPVSKKRYESLSAPAQRAIVQAINRSFKPLNVRSPLLRRERELDRVVRLIALFEPFILQNQHVFEAANVERLSLLLPAEERSDFGYDARSIDWWDYWINVHIPALRKWSYPLIEGGKPEPHAPRTIALGRERPEQPVAISDRGRDVPAGEA
jgi:fatty acyl-CoA reductase